MFGYTARHVKVRRTDTCNPPGDSWEMHDDTDGWYIDAWPRYSEAKSLGYAGCKSLRRDEVPEQDEIRITRTGPDETGLPIILKRGTTYDRVIEFSEDALDPALFAPPADFKRVPEPPPGTVGEGRSVEYHYPWTMGLRLRWLMLTDLL